jgi:hypothetical protein
MIKTKGFSSDEHGAEEESEFFTSVHSISAFQSSDLIHKIDRNKGQLMTRGQGDVISVFINPLSVHRRAQLT